MSATAAPLTSSGVVDCVLFDLDGTLLDTPHAIARELAAAVLEAIGVEVAASTARALIGLPLEVMVARLVPTATVEEQCRAVEEYRVRFRERIVPQASGLLYPGVVDGLGRLRAAGLTLAVVTSKFHDSATAMLASAGIADAFAVVVGADDAEHPKPHPDHALQALRSLGRAPSTTVVVGDTAHDVQMALAAGMQCVGLDHGVDDAPTLREAGATTVLSHVDDLISLLSDPVPVRS